MRRQGNSVILIDFFAVLLYFHHVPAVLNYA